jgi:hypothetical protein
MRISSFSTSSARRRISSIVGRARRDRLDHVLQAILDALGDLDLALAREQLHRAHLAHVHAHRVGGAAEFGVDRGRERLLGLLDHVLLGDRGRGLGHEELLGVRGLVVHGYAHVGEHRDHALDLLGVGHVVGQVVVDLGVGEVPALLAEDDQGLQALFLRLDLGELVLGAVLVVLLLARFLHEIGSQLDVPGKAFNFIRISTQLRRPDSPRGQWPGVPGAHRIPPSRRGSRCPL